MGEAVEDGVEGEQDVISVAHRHGDQDQAAEQECQVSQAQAGQQRGEYGPHHPVIMEKN